MGNGLLFFDYLMAVLVSLCALAHFAILRAPDITESETIQAIRRIKIGALLILSMRFWYVLYSTGDLLVPPATEMGLTLLVGAELYRTVYRLFQAKMDLHQEQRSRKGRRKICDD